MTRCLHLDCVGGIAGDMLLAGLIDAGADIEQIRAGMPLPEIGLSVEHVARAGVAAVKLTVDSGSDSHHRTWSDIRAIIDFSGMPSAARELAHLVFERLALAESAVHRISPEEVHFHEVGAVDAIADICGVALALRSLEVDEVTCSPLPLGHGLVTGAHGVMPLPAPATVELLRDVPVYGIDLNGETVTPTGAALVTALVSQFGPPPPMRLNTIGVGAGSRDPDNIPNIVRVFVGTPTDRDTVPQWQGPLLLQTNLDDILPEMVPDAIEAIMMAGAADVWTTPIVMKRGRPALTLSALVPPKSERGVAEAILRCTPAIGVRVIRTEHRWELSREFRTIHVCGGPIRIKIARLGRQIVNVKPEYRDCLRIAQESRQSVKAVWATAFARAHEEFPVDGALR